MAVHKVDEFGAAISKRPNDVIILSHSCYNITILQYSTTVILWRGEEQATVLYFSRLYDRSGLVPESLVPANSTAPAIGWTCLLRGAGTPQ